VILPVFVWSVRQAEHGLGSQFGAVILAAFHSGFTFLTALLILPGVKRFSSIVERLVPERGPALTRNLDSSLVELPEVAIEAVRRTLMDVSAEILDEIERGLRGDAIPSRSDRIDTALAALKETRRFLGLVSFPASRPGQLNARISVIHALDHLNQLAVVVKDNFKPSLLNGEQRLQEPKRTVLEMVEAAAASLRRQAPAPERDQLQRLSLALAEHRRAERAALLEESARGTVEPGQALHTLDGLRWLDAVGYHTWRALYHLSTDTNEAEDGSAIARDQEEFTND
jgi:phosphate:Na+ symporter